MTDQVACFCARWPEREPFFMLVHVEGWENHTGAEALRRSGGDFTRFSYSRMAGGPWIIPLMRLEFVQARRRRPVAKPAPPDIFLGVGALYVTDRALEVVRPCCYLVPGRHPSDEIEFLPVELEDGGRLWQINAPVLEDVLDEDRSGLIRADGRGQIVAVYRAVLRRERLTQDAVFTPLRRYSLPILSAALVGALKHAGMAGLDWEAVEIAG